MIRYILKGGSYYIDSWLLRTSFRYWPRPVNRVRKCGFRLVIRRKAA